MIVLGITGGSGCGKTTALERVQAMGGGIIDCDRLYHRLLREDRELVRRIGDAFPGTVEAGQVDLPRLGRQAFSDPEALARLNALTHPAVVRAVRQELERERAAGRSLMAIDAAALLESGLDRLCDATVAVTAPEEARVRRLMRRDGIPEDYARLRLRAQKSNEEFARQCTCRLENDQPTPQAFGRVCDGFLKELLGGIDNERKKTDGSAGEAAVSAEKRL